MNKDIKKVELFVLKTKLKIQPMFDGFYFKRIEREKPPKLNEYNAHQFVQKDELFKGLNPSHYKFDYRRPVKLWKNYDQIK